MGMTNYIDRKLKRTNERIVYRAHLSWIPIVVGAIPLMMLTSVIAGALYGLFDNFGYVLLAYVIGILLVILTRVPKIMKNIGTDIVVTDRRLHTKTGLINVDNDRETPLTNIDDTIADPTVFGRMMGYGDVSVHTFGGGQGMDDSFVFKGVADPFELVAVINETRDGLAAGGASPYATFQQHQQEHSSGTRGRRR